MFGKLKEKLKNAISIFSKKTEEEAKEEYIEVKAQPEAKKEKEIEYQIRAKTSNKQFIDNLLKETERKEKDKEVLTTKEQAKKIREEQQREIPSEKKIEIKETKKKETPETKPKTEEITQPIQAENQRLTEDEIQIITEKEVSTEKEDIKEIIQDKPIEEKKSFFSGWFKKKEKEIEVTKAEVKEEQKIEITEKIIPQVKAEERKIDEKKKEEHKEPRIEKKEEPKIEQKKEKSEENIIEDKKEVLENLETKKEEKKSIFEKVKESITTRKISADKFEELFWELELALLENNVSVEVIEKIKLDLEKELVDKPLPWDIEKKIEDTLKNTLSEILSFKTIDILTEAKNKKPLIIAFFGVNGAGKTTSIAKLAYYLQQNKLSVVFAACDTFRAAAIQQLEEHANNLKIKIIKQDYGSDAAAVAYDAVKYAEKNKIDVVMIDTAGRLHSNTNLMAELEKIIRVVKPHLKFFVGESITGNDCIEQARNFNKLVEMDGAILTKADVDEKGGAPLSITYTIKKPILFLGVGQKYSDLEKFDAQKIIRNLGLE